MNRRDASLALLLGPLMFGAASPSTRAQQPAAKVYRIGYLSAPSRESVAPVLEAFLSGLRQLGWIEGQNLVIEYRWAEGRVERLPGLAAELVRANVDVIVAPAGSAVLAAKNATTIIPIVMIFPTDPVQLRFVASLAHPGGNITGTTLTAGPEIFGKQVQILKEAVPQASRVAILSNPADPESADQVAEVEAAARSLGMRPQRIVARGPEEFDTAFASMGREHADALLVMGGSTFLVHRTRVAELAARTRLPAMYSYRENVEAGGLMAYAVNMADFVGRAAIYVDKIFRGAKPSDLPIERPTKFELVINLKAAGAVGLTIPTALLLRADDLIR